MYETDRLKRRLKGISLSPILRPHSYCVLVVTDQLSQEVLLEDLQYLAGHANPGTTQIHESGRGCVTRNMFERISVRDVDKDPKAFSVEQT